MGLPLSDADKFLMQSYVRHKKYLVHDEKNQLSVGDAIRAVACRPLSARKHFTFTERIGGANAGAERRARAEQMMSAEQKERIRIEKLIKDQRSSSSQSTPSSKRP